MTTTTASGLTPARARRTVAAQLLLVALAVGHATLTWPPAAVVALFGGGVVVAVVPEVLAVRLGLLEHHLPGRVAGVPVTLLASWPAVVYLWYRLAALVVGPLPAVGLAALLATAADALAEPRSVRQGLWSYPAHRLSRVRLAGIPWWNYAGWPVVVGLTATLPLLVG